MTEQKAIRDPFFTADRGFYKTLFQMLLVVALQNLVAYSVNMGDNIMLGVYSQASLSAAATVNQVFFMVQQFALSIGNALVALGAQYWGQGRAEPVRTLTGIALKLGMIISAAIIGVCLLFPEPLLYLFTDSAEIVAEGARYLSLIQWTFALFILTNVLMSALRSVGIVNISFYVSVASLVVNVGINYTLIFGRFGFPELGIVGAAVGTLVARLLEFFIVLLYILKFDRKLRLFCGGDLWKRDRSLRRDFTKVYLPIMLSQVLWGISVPMQTAILGHLSDDAIAANSIATTFYQYLKVIVIAMSSVSAVMIGNAIGRGDRKRIKSDARTMAVIDVLIGGALGAVLFLLRRPLVSLYTLTPAASDMAVNLVAIMSVVMVGMSYQMPVSFGIIQGGGDAGFTMRMNLISTWCIVMPLSFLAAFWWKWPVEAVVLVIQSDQIFKGLPTFLRFRKYQWMKKLTKDA